MTSPSPPHQISIFLEEYKEVGANLRQYGNMRFAQLTLFVAVTGGLLAANFSKDIGLSACQKLAVAFFGLLISMAFWVMEERSTDWWNRYYKRAEQIELELGMHQYLHRKNRSILSATFAVRAVFAVVVMAWFGLLIAGISGLVCHA
ncbi:hypothetical protein [Sulfuriferula nivalis]|uniref:hypothetical protein n=1 Tax=Sulfuriferula nivalis TaxID=2675298 RepID=UPI0013896B33|nr:hypothetical protein [Sulfuriferula nivalis]